MNSKDKTLESLLTILEEGAKILKEILETPDSKIHSPKYKVGEEVVYRLEMWYIENYIFVNTKQGGIWVYTLSKDHTWNRISYVAEDLL